MEHDLLNPIQSPKPHPILSAERALTVWIIWTCLFGIYQTWTEIPDINDAMSQLDGVISITSTQLLIITVVGYAALAGLTYWFLRKIGQGKKWARSSFLWGFIFQAGWTLCPPYHPILEYLSDIPDLGLQAYALHMLYKKQVNSWFESVPK